jgi:hypothetical protein
MNKVKRIARLRYYAQKYGEKIAPTLSDNRNFGSRRRMHPDQMKNARSLTSIRQSRLADVHRQYAAVDKSRKREHSRKV